MTNEEIEQEIDDLYTNKSNSRFTPVIRRPLWTISAADWANLWKPAREPTEEEKALHRAIKHHQP